MWFTDRLDKRGRRVKQTSSEDLQRFYDLEGTCTRLFLSLLRVVSDSSLPNTETKGKVEEIVSTNALCKEEEVDNSEEKLEENSEEENIDGEDEEDIDNSSTDTDDDDNFSDEDSEV